MARLRQVALVLMLPKTLLGYWEEASPEPYTNPPSMRHARVEFTEYIPYYYQKFPEQIGDAQQFHTCAVTYLTENLSTATILGYRVLITAANFLEPYKENAKSLRVWCFDARGDNERPQRYRVWRTTRVIPKSLNPEHGVTRFGRYVLRHDVALIYTQDTLYLSKWLPTWRSIAYPATLTGKYDPLPGPCRFHGMGYRSEEELRLNYKISSYEVPTDDIVDCSEFLPKFWGKFICFRNEESLYGVSNGAGLFCGGWYDTRLFGIGAFEIRYNEDRVFVFTDLRYYIGRLPNFTRVAYKEYYEYAEQEFNDFWKSKWLLYPDLN